MHGEDDDDDADDADVGADDDYDDDDDDRAAGYREHKLSEFDDCLDPGLALITDWMQISGNNGFSLDMLCAVLDSLARDDICAVLRNVSSESRRRRSVRERRCWCRLQDAQDVSAGI